MKERKYVKFRVDMYDDTKFKIIDMKPERDLIHYVWARIVTLAGKVNLDGDLYLSKSIPYTIETLAIEFNRGSYQIKLALDVLIQLEMIELKEGNIYSVKNFTKHQNENVRAKRKKELSDIKEAKAKEISDYKLKNNKVDESDNDKARDINDKKGKKNEGEINKKTIKNKKSINNNSSNGLQITPKEVGDGKGYKKSVDNTGNNNSQGSSRSLEKKKDNVLKKKDGKASSNKGLLNDISAMEEEINENDAICCITDGEIALDKDEIIIAEWSFD